MKREQLEIIIAAANDDETDDTDWESAIDAVNAEAEAMHTPITAEALTAAGWVVSLKMLSGGDIYQCPTNKRIEIGLWSDDRTFYHNNFGGVIPMPQNMHDLTELVRLLGGEG